MEISTENKENTTHGCLKFNDKIYPVYEGHNTIGRNSDAIININNLTVSKHHAVITILDHGTHFISDLKSSSGTLLNEKKLTPLLLYKLNNGASIKFGNAYCTYKKLEVGNSFKKSSDDTSQFSESFYIQQTQEVETSNLPDGINFNELPTQIFSAKDLNIHEMPTQLQAFSSITDDSSNDSIDFMTMQKTTETQCLQNTDLQEARSEKNSVETEHSLSQICPVTLNTKKIVDSDDDLTPSSQILISKSRKEQNIIESDSSDTEEYVIDKTIKTKYCIDDDSETDVENEQNQTCKETEISEEKNQEEENPSVIIDDINNSPILSKGTPRINKEVIPQDHLYCQSLSHSQIEFEKNEANLDEKKKIEEEMENLNLLKIDENKESSHNPNNIPDELTRELDVNLLTKKKQSEENAQNETTNEDNIFLQPTQSINIFEENLSSVKEPQKSVDDKIYLITTQTVEIDTQEKSQVTDEMANQKEKDNNLQIVVNDDLQPTQALEILHKDDNPEQNQLNIKSNKSFDSNVENKELFISGTQDLEQLLSDDGLSTSNKKDVFLVPNLFLESSPSKRLSPRKKPLTLMLSKDDDDDDDDDEDILQPTQALEILHEDANLYNKVEDQLHEIFASQSLLCTQQLVDVLNTSRDEVIEDSLLQQRRSLNLKNEKPLSDEVVRNVLSEDMDVNVEEKTKDKINDKLKDNKKNDTNSEKDKEMKQKNINTRTTRSRVNENSTNSNKTVTKRTNEKEEIKEDKSKKAKNIKSKMEEKKQVDDLVATSTRQNRKKVKSEEIKSNEEKLESSSTESQTSTTSRKLRRSHFDEANSESSKNGTNIKSEEITAKRKKIKKDRESSNETNKSESQYSERCTRSTRSTKNKENKEDKQIEEKNKPKSQNNEDVIKRRVRPKNEDLELKSKKKIDNTESEDLRKTNKLRNRNEEKEECSVRKSTRNKSKINDSESNSKIDKLKEIATQTNKKTNKRKKNMEDEIPKTPTKKKSIENKSMSLQKLSLKLPTSDSEDEFETSPVRISKQNDSLTKTRKSSRRLKSGENNDEAGISFNKSELATSTPFVQPNAKQRRLSANSRRQKREQEEEQLNTTTTRKGEKSDSVSSLLTTPERSRRILKPKVVFTMMDNSALESLIRQLGGSVVENVDVCTVLVTENVKRSQKLLCAVGQGKPICSPKWLLACKKSFSFVDPWNHLLVDQEAEKKWKFSLRESLNRSTKKKLLKDYTFQLIVNNAADVLKGAIESCGGKCVTRNFVKCDSKNLIIVSTKDHKSKYSKITKLKPGIKVVEPEAIFDGTLRQEFRFDNFLLS